MKILKNDADSIVFTETLPPMSFTLKNPTTIFLVILSSFVADLYIMQGQNLPLVFILLPLYVACISLVVFIYVALYSKLIIAFPVRATIDKINNTLSILQKGAYSNHTTTIDIDKISQINTFGNRFYYSQMTNLLIVEMGLNWGESLANTCGIHFSLNSGEKISVNSTNDSYTGVYKHIADKIGEIIGVPVDK